MNNIKEAGKRGNARIFYRSNISIRVSMASMFLLVNEKMTEPQQLAYYMKFDALVTIMEGYRRAYLAANDDLRQEFLIEHRIFRDQLYRLAFQQAKAALH